MTRSQRWCLHAGLISLLLISALSAAATIVSGPPSSHAPSGHRSATQGRKPLDDENAGRPPRTILQGARALPAIASGTEMRAMEQALLSRMSSPRLRPATFGLDLATGSFFSVRGEDSIAAASLIKVPISVALLAAADRSEVSLDETLVLRADHMAAGSGHIQYLPAGTVFSISRLGELMMRRSDNTATNMLIERLGGASALNGLFADWGISSTAIRSPLPDMSGSNRTSPRDLVTVLNAALEGGLLSGPSRATLLEWMSRSRVRSMIPASAARGAFVANKTGDIPGALGDTAYVVGSGGTRYLLAIQVERPHNSARAKELIRNLAGLVWENLAGSPSPALRTARRSPRSCVSRKVQPRARRS